MSELRRKSFTAPDETLCLPGLDEDVVELAGFTVAKVVQAPGWVWSRDMRPLIGAGDYCETRHRLAFEDLGDRELKGLDGPRRLWALRTEPGAGSHTLT